MLIDFEAFSNVVWFLHYEIRREIWKRKKKLIYIAKHKNCSLTEALHHIVTSSNNPLACFSSFYLTLEDLKQKISTFSVKPWLLNIFFARDSMILFNYFCIFVKLCAIICNSFCDYFDCFCVDFSPVWFFFGVFLFPRVIIFVIICDYLCDVFFELLLLMFI